MENWDEVKSAFKVVEAGTVSGAGKALDVHHATIIRHIDALEARTSRITPDLLNGCSSR